MGVKVERLFVQRMKTQWDSCNPGASRMTLGQPAPTFIEAFDVTI
jgi:hypothetical protein